MAAAPLVPAIAASEPGDLDSCDSVQSLLGATFRDLGLSQFSAVMCARFAEKHALDLPHVNAWFWELQSKGRAPCSVLRPPSLWQRGCPEVIPGLTAHPFWLSPMHSWPGSSVSTAAAADGGYDTGARARALALLDAIQQLQRDSAGIRDEVLSLRGKGAFQPYRAPQWSHGHPSSAPTASAVAAGASSDIGASAVGGSKGGVDSGDWHVLYLQLHNTDCGEAQAMLPRTMAAMQRLPRRYGHTFVSAMAPGTHISTHTGPTNKKLRVHLPLVVPAHAGTTATSEVRGPCMPPSGGVAADGSAGGEIAAPAVLGDIPAVQQPLCRLRAGPDTVGWQEGQALVFDDSFQHEAWNDHATEPRLVLIIDVWHPDLTDAEVKLLDTIRSGQLRAAKALSRSGTLAGAADFYAVLEAAAAARGTVDERAVFPSGVTERVFERESSGQTPAHDGLDGGLGSHSESCTAAVPMLFAPVRDD